MRYGGFPAYVSVAEKKATATKALDKLRRKNPNIQPVIIEGRTIAKTWWGKAWNQNMENYADFGNRIARGRSYVRNNTVLDLQITKGTIKALVQGSSAKPYSVLISIDPLSKEKWGKVIDLCNHRIDNLEQLLGGGFPKELEALFVEKEYGFFPSPKEIHFGCSCPDSASMCKHISAVLYGIGARLDASPMLFFDLRDIDGMKLIKKSMEMKLDSMLRNAGKKTNRQIADEEVSSIFGI